jgi:hypothetical protein
MNAPFGVWPKCSAVRLRIMRRLQKAQASHRTRTAGFDNDTPMNHCIKRSEPATKSATNACQCWRSVASLSVGGGPARCYRSGDLPCQELFAHFLIAKKSFGSFGLPGAVPGTE